MAGSARPTASSAGRPAARARGVAVAPAVAAVLALVITLVVVATDNPVRLRVALLAVCWAAVVGVFLFGSRRADRLAAERREMALRHEHELELQRHAAARRAQDLAVENELRRESEEGMRTELTRLREDLAVLAGAAGDPEGVLTALTQLRTELAGLGDLRNDLGRIRAELTDRRPGELMVERMVMRAQSVRLPADREDGTRVLAAVGEEPVPQMWETTRIDSDQWPAEQWDNTRFDRVRPGVGGRPAVEGPRPAVPPAAAPSPAPHRRPPVPPAARTPEPPVLQETPATAVQPAVPAPQPELQPEARVEVRPRSPLQWLYDRSLVEQTGQAEQVAEAEPATTAFAVPPADEPATTPEPAAPRRHRRAAEPDDEPAAASRPRRSHAAPDTATDLDLTPASEPTAPESERTWKTPSWERPSWETHSWETPSWETPSWAEPTVPRAAEAPEPAVEAADDSGSAGEWSATDWSISVPETPSAGSHAADDEPAGHARLAEILAQNEPRPTEGGRRRRRYRDEDAPAAQDDVLARVLGRT